MRIFVVNCGSSSIKYQLFGSDDGQRPSAVLAKGLVERIGTPGAELHQTVGERSESRAVEVPDHSVAVRAILAALTDAEAGVLADVGQIDGVGHRVVHGGEAVTGSARVDDALLDVVRRNAELAPLHNPANLAGIESVMAAMPGTPNVAVFDTAFLATLPPKAHRYAVPEAWYREHHVRKYGFHGTSHRYVTMRAAELLGRPSDELNLITCHLGNGCSMTAVAGGRAVDHSMGLTPLEGLVMGTRSGDIDAAVVPFLTGRGLTVAEVDEALNKQSGLLGVSGVSNDMRDCLTAAEAGDAAASLAVEMFVYRVVKYVGAYYAILPGVDAVVLTGGIGENSVPVRRRICEDLSRLGARLDDARNAETVGGKAAPLTADGAELPVWVVPTNEELMIALDTARLIGSDEATGT